VQAHVDAQEKRLESVLQQRLERATDAVADRFEERLRRIVADVHGAAEDRLRRHAQALTQEADELRAASAPAADDAPRMAERPHDPAETRETAPAS
jgi:hypothetical protein